MQLTDDSVQSISSLPTEAAKGVVTLTGELHPKANYPRHGCTLRQCATQKEKCAIIPCMNCGRTTARELNRHFLAGVKCSE